MIKKAVPDDYMAILGGVLKLFGRFLLNSDTDFTHDF
jgi:hypothetical protein